jgi:hypothetical protein
MRCVFARTLMNLRCIMTFDGRSTARTCRAVALAQADPYEFAMYYDV